MNAMIKCVIIDDEPLARECIAGYIQESGFLQLVGSGTNPIELNTIIDREPVDLVFLDIEMPVMNGIEYIRMTPNPPMVIITTAYPSYALEGFQLDVLDYLVKPITFTRFFKAANKAKDYHKLLQTANGSKGEESDFFFIKCDYKYEKIYFADILFIQALQNYITIHTTKGKYVTLLYLKSIEEKLDSNTFIRVHKSYIVSVARIQSIENNEVIIQSFRIPISRNYQTEVLDRVVNDRLWKKG
jgi:DNA-binding LytR/AlgR family response regulator